MSCTVCEGHTVRTVEPLDLTDELSVGRIHHHYAIFACNEDAVPGGIERKVVPASVAAELVAVGDVVLAVLCGKRERNRKRRNQGELTDGTQCHLRFSNRRGTVSAIGWEP